MSEKVLIMLSEWGYWGEEFIGPRDVLEREGIAFDIWTPTGRIPRALPPSMTLGINDPPLGKSVVSAEMVDAVQKVDKDAANYFSKVISLADRFPLRPYLSETHEENDQRVVAKGQVPVLRKLEEYYLERENAQARAVKEYSAILLVGGSGPMVDMVNNRRVHDLILGFYFAGKPIAAECYGVACLSQAREFDDCRSIILGKHVTGHAKEYDYTDYTGVVDPTTGQMLLNSKGEVLDFGPPFYTLEYILRDAVGPNGQFHGNFGRPISVIVDYPFITGRSTPDAYATGEQLVKVLRDPSYRRYGW